METEIIRYSRPVRWLHWTYAGAFLVLFLTGVIIFIPALDKLAGGEWTRMFHRGAAILLFVEPIAYLILYPNSAWRGIKETFIWSKDDLDWARAMPRYYFFLDEKAMPPQGHINTGQKLWWLMVLVSWVVFAVTGVLIVVSKGLPTRALFEWSIMLHDVAFIGTGCMLFVHIFLSVIHPLMRPLRSGPWNAMVHGTVSREYARSHHRKWYEEINKVEIRNTDSPDSVPLVSSTAVDRFPGLRR